MRAWYWLATWRIVLAAEPIAPAYHQVVDDAASGMDIVPAERERP